MDIRARILARTQPDDLRVAKDLDGLAAALNAEGLTAPQQRFITARAVMALCPDGVAILTALENARSSSKAIDWALTFLGQEAGLDIGDPFTQSMITQLVAGTVLTESQGNQLKALATVPLIVTRDQVAEALYNDDGSEK